MKKVTIVGAGALGSHVAMLLRSEAELKVIDFDRVETKNTLAQFHARTAVGKNKAEALKALMNFTWGVRIEAVPHKLTDENVHTLLRDPDLVIDCVDNGATRRLMKYYMALRQQTSVTSGDDTTQYAHLLHGALAADGAFGRSIWDEAFVVDDEDGTGQATCEGGEHLPFIGVVASYVARSAQLFLRKGEKVGYSISPAGVFTV